MQHWLDPSLVVFIQRAAQLRISFQPTIPHFSLNNGWLSKRQFLIIPVDNQVKKLQFRNKLEYDHYNNLSEIPAIAAFASVRMTAGRS